MKSIAIPCHSLRLIFPHVFHQGATEEVALAISSGDHPGTRVDDCVINGDFPLLFSL